MEVELLIVFGVILGALILFISGVVPVDQTAIIVMVSLMVTGILTPDEGLAGFSNSATITVLALLIISQALKNTGVVDVLGDQMLKISGYGQYVTILAVMVIAAFASAFINTTAVVAVFIPIAYKIAEKTKLKVALLLMPLSFAAMVGGASTMIGTSTNLLINSVSKSNGLSGFDIFELSALGVVLLLAVIIYMLVIGLRMLDKKPESISLYDKKIEAKNYLTEVLIVPGSKLIGKKFAELKLYDKKEYMLQRLIRNNEVIKPDEALTVQENDIITIKTDIHEIININNNPELRILTNIDDETIDEEQFEKDRVLIEALVVPNSNLIGRKIKEVDFQRYYDAFPLAVRRGGLLKERKLMDHKLQVGDILLMDGKHQTETEQTKHDWIIIQEISRNKIEKQLASRQKMLTSIIILLGVILMAVSNIMPIVVSAWLGVVVLFLTGCITVKKAYENIEWRVIFLLAGIIPMGTALTKTGGDQFLADFIVQIGEGSPPRVVISVMFIFTTLLTGILSNQATAILLVPIAIKIAESTGIPPEALVVAVLFGANTSFITPVGYQTNAMIYGPGNYNFSDFLKVGGLLSLLFWLLTTILIPIFYM